MKYLSSRNKFLILFSFAYIFLGFLMYIILFDFLSIIIAWNIVLALMPLFILILFNKVYNKEEYTKFHKNIILVIIYICYLLFFPNTFYLITDMIHINSIDFYTVEHYSPMSYLSNFDSWAILLYISGGIFLGVYLGIYAFYGMFDIFKDKCSTYINHLYIGSFSLLSSIGIYIGRFLRFNTWDIFNPIRITIKLFSSLDLFSLLFIIMFFIIHLIFLYFVFINRYVIKNKGI